MAACSSAAANKFTVRRRPAVLVTPAGPNPREPKRLSDIDDQEHLRFHTPAILLYRRNESMAGKDPAQVIREALAKALVHYYPFTGRLREHDDGRKLAVDCTGEGVLFIEADADVGIDHMEYMLSTADLILLRRGQTMCPTVGSYTLVDETKFRYFADDLDFGWGRTVYVGPAQAVVVPSLPWVSSFLIPFKNSDGEDGIVVPVCLPDPAMNRLVEEMGNLCRPLVDDETMLQQPRALFPVIKRSAL